MLRYIDVLLTFEKGIQREITKAETAKDNNKYLTDQCNPYKISTCLENLNANNLYG